MVLVCTGVENVRDIHIVQEPISNRKNTDIDTRTAIQTENNNENDECGSVRTQIPIWLRGDTSGILIPFIALDEEHWPMNCPYCAVTTTQKWNSPGFGESKKRNMVDDEEGLCQNSTTFISLAFILPLWYNVRVYSLRTSSASSLAGLKFGRAAFFLPFF
jgi:hypothetical protein